MDKIGHCRICGSALTDVVLDLGAQALTGMFLKNGADVPVCEMSLSACSAADCGLVQINEVYDLGLLYGDHYGYASGLNSSMVEHLRQKAQRLQSKVALETGDVVIDIGSNDATTLSFFPEDMRRIGVDATGGKFAANYADIGAELVLAFFPTDMLIDSLNGKKAKIVSSYSCFYDLPSPLAFARGIASILDDGGLWCLEQSYMPAMLESNSFDTVCHEHIEYYRLLDIHHICQAAGLRILDVQFNDVNGGSFSLDVVKDTSSLPTTGAVRQVLEREERTDWKQEFSLFRQRIETRKNELLSLLQDLKSKGKRVVGLGASTKGNVLLQHYGITAELIDCIGEVNAEKFGCQTPGTCIPIVSEDELLGSNPDYWLVLPWHFRTFFLNSPKFKGRKLIFPLPSVEIVELN